MNIQWYPGHMTKARRMMQENIRLVDLVIELVDARVPYSSRNPDIDELGKNKARLLLLNKADLADEAANEAWSAHFREQGFQVVKLDSRSRTGLKAVQAAVQEACREKTERDRKRGILNRPVRAMVAGIPNVGKSTFINKVAKRKTAKAEDRPGVTRTQQWVPVDRSLELMDTPGMLWPKFDDPQVGLHLAFTGAVRDEIMDTETLACRLMELLAQRYPQALADRYKVEIGPEDTGYDLLIQAGRRRGFMVRGGEVDTERMARILLDEFRGGKLGRFTLELPEDIQG